MTPQQGWQAALVELLGIELWRIPVTVFAAVAIYCTFLVLLRIFGSRVLSTLSAFDAIVLIMFGAVAGRVIIGHPPSLSAGIIGLITLLSLEAVFGSLRRWRPLQRALEGRGYVLMVAGRELEENMRASHVTRADLAVAVRGAGLTRWEDALCAVLEPNGKLSVLRCGADADEELFADLVGGDEVIAEVRRRRAQADSEG